MKSANPDHAVIIFGASGMVGKGVLIECLEDPSISKILVVGRSSCGVENVKLEEILHNDFMDFTKIQDQLRGYDACFFTLGISVIGLSEEKYQRITYDFTLSAARMVLEKNPEMVFCYVSGAGTDSTEKGRTMWARVKGKTENAVLNMGFRDAYAFRPGYIQPKKGVRSKVWWYQALYDVFGILYPVLKSIFPKMVTSSDRVGRAMINSISHGLKKKHLENRDINELAKKYQ